MKKLFICLVVCLLNFSCSMFITFTDNYNNIYVTKFLGINKLFFKLYPQKNKSKSEFTNYLIDTNAIYISTDANAIIEFPTQDKIVSSHSVLRFYPNGRVFRKQIYFDIEKKIIDTILYLNIEYTKKELGDYLKQDSLSNIQYTNGELGYYAFKKDSLSNIILVEWPTPYFLDALKSFYFIKSNKDKDTLTLYKVCDVASIWCNPHKFLKKEKKTNCVYVNRKYVRVKVNKSKSYAYW